MSTKFMPFSFLYHSWNSCNGSMLGPSVLVGMRATQLLTDLYDRATCRRVCGALTGKVHLIRKNM